MMGGLLSINVGLPQEVLYGRKEVFTAGVKTPVPEAYLHFTNLDGDRQADLDQQLPAGP